MRLPTVAVKAENETGFMLINKSDLTDKHELYLPGDNIQDNGDNSKNEEKKTRRSRKKTSE